MDLIFNQRLRGVLAVLGAALIWGTLPLTLAVVDGSPLIKVFFRVWVALVIMTVFMLVSKRLRRIRRLRRPMVGQLMLQGMILGVNWALFLYAFDLASVAVVELLMYMGPIFVAIIAPFALHEKFDRRIVVPLVLSFVGMVIILAPHGLSVSQGELVGASLAFISAITYAILMIRNKQFVSKVSAPVVVWFGYVGALVVLVPLAVFAYATSQGPTGGWPMYQWLFFMGAVQTAAASLLFFYGLKRLRADQTAVLTYMEPVTAIIFAALWMGQALTPATVFGGMMVVVGGTFVARMKAREGIEVLPAAAVAPEEDTPITAPGSGALSRLYELNAIRRLAERDATLFTSDPAIAETVAQRLGWVSLARDTEPYAEQLARLAEDSESRGVQHVVIVGMGGSSLASLVLSDVLAGEGVRRTVLDTTCPEDITAVLDTVDFRTALFVVSSKSGTTLEVTSVGSILFERAVATIGREEAASRFVVISDPDTPLADMAAELGWWKTVRARASVGGRFSAMSMFGLVPAALARVDYLRVVEGAGAVEAACRNEPPATNPAALLAAMLSEGYDEGRDKLILIFSDRYRSFGLWLEQLVAESLGKGGQGIVPIITTAERYGEAVWGDHTAVVIRDVHDLKMADYAALLSQTGPVAEYTLDDPHDIGAEFVRWKFATALTGVLLNVNPFDQPDVEAAKCATSHALAGELPAAVTLPLSELREVVGYRDYVAVLAYLPDTAENTAELERLVTRLERELGAVTTFQRGPRYLHSTGQLHKGGQNTGVFIVVGGCDTDPATGSNGRPRGRTRPDLSIPGASYSLRELFDAQRVGDTASLVAAGRRVFAAECVADINEALTTSAAEVDRGEL